MDVAYINGSVGSLLALLVNLLIYIIIAEIILSWLPLLGVRLSRQNPFVKVVHTIADPILQPIRRILPHPSRTGGLDFAPMLAILLLGVLERILWSL